MSHLNTIDKRILEDYLQMGGGHVLDFSIRELRDSVFDFCGVDIYTNEFEDHGESKAKRLRCFFSKASKQQLAGALRGLLDYARAFISERDISKEEAIENMIVRLQGKQASQEIEGESFLEKKFPKVDFSSLSLESSFVEILELRWNEVGNCRTAKAYLSAVIMTGSLLEAVLLGVASRNQSAFNQSKSTPRNENGKPKQFHKWNLACLIDVAYETGWIDLDVKKHSHSLRGFRNYIHPFEQKVSGFNPTEETLAISMQVFRAAITQIKNKS